MELLRRLLGTFFAPRSVSDQSCPTAILVNMNALQTRLEAGETIESIVSTAPEVISHAQTLAESPALSGNPTLPDSLDAAEELTIGGTRPDSA